MPEHKNQHFVPRCHLKFFAADNEGRSINVFNLDRPLLIQNASIKGQCSRPYFYGTDRTLERALQPLEGEYARIVHRLVQRQDATLGELSFLRDFSHLQYLRTDVAVRRTLIAQAEMEELISEGASGPNRFIIPISPTETAQEAVQMFLETRQHIADLKTRIIRNHTREALITSDDPAVQLNRLYVQRFGPFVGSGGLINSGFTIFMPLSPVLALCVYDPFVYTCPNHSGHFINVRDTADISALNRLQYLKAASNIYFSDWSQRERIRGEFSDASSRRPSSWHRLNYAVEEPSNSGSSTTRTFRAVHTRAARISAQRALLHTETTMLNPGAWFSPLQIRSSPRFVNTRSGLGYLRPSRINANIA